ncbi:MAG: hypothetical protein AAF709_10575 [Pseudomonadota bacterium]
MAKFVLFNLYGTARHVAINIDLVREIEEDPRDGHAVLVFERKRESDLEPRAGALFAHVVHVTEQCEQLFDRIDAL